MAVTTTRKASAFVLALKDIHSRNLGTALRFSEGSQGSLGKEWLEGWTSSVGWSTAELVYEQVKWQSAKGKWQN
jgi:hypothetical protein